jgi:hypothetical protein
MAESLEAWFKREILPQEEAFLRYLLRVWPKRDEIADLRQEVYARVFDSAAASSGAAPGEPLVTRPLCAYPKVAHWTGKGSSDKAENYLCR